MILLRMWVRHHDTDCQNVRRHLYELAVEEQLVEAIGGQMEEIRQIFMKIRII